MIARRAGVPGPARLDVVQTHPHSTDVTPEDTFPWPTHDTRAAIGRAVERWRLLDEAGTVIGAEIPTRARSEDELRDAARRAGEVYPGAAGELIARELLALADFGHGPVDGGCLAARLVDQVLTADLPRAPG